MKRRSITYIILKAALITLCLPLSLFLLLIVSLYIPAVQRYTVDKLCETINEQSNYEIRIKNFHLFFPLKININDFDVKKEQISYAQGENIGISISPLSLLKGEVEVNYISLENIALNTRELIPNVKIEGCVGYLQSVARNIDIKNETVNLRQLLLKGANVNIELSDTAENKKKNNAAWIVKLNKGIVDNCNINVKIPANTLEASISIGNLRLKSGEVDLKKELYNIAEIKIDNTAADIFQGDKSLSASPLSKTSLTDIRTTISNVLYSPNKSNINIENLLFTQPEGIEITSCNATITADSTNIDIKNFAINSRNGSRITAKGEIPIEAIKNDKKQLNTTLSLALNKKDLTGFFTKEELEKLNIFNSDFFSAEVKAKGNIKKLDLNEIILDVPSLCSLKANGFVENIEKPQDIIAGINIENLTGDINKILKTQKRAKRKNILKANGKLSYANNKANADIIIKAPKGRIKAIGTYNISNNTYNADIKVNKLNLNRIFPKVPLLHADLNLQAEGKGFDIFSNTTHYTINARLDSIVYDKYNLFDINMNIRQANGLSVIDATGDNKDLLFKIKAETELLKKKIKNQTSIEVLEANLQKIGVNENITGTTLNLDVQATSDFKKSHSLKFHGKNITIKTPQQDFIPEEIHFDFGTTPEETYIAANNGDLEIRGNMQGGYEKLFNSIGKISKMFSNTKNGDNTLYFLQDYEKELPAIKIDFDCGQNNMLYTLMAMKNMSLKNVDFSLKFDQKRGINMNCKILELRKEDINLDTIRIFARQQKDRIRYVASVRSTAINPQNKKQTYYASLNGNIFNDSLTTNFTFNDRQDALSIQLGTKTSFTPENIEIRFNNDAILFGNNFNFNKDNFLKIGKGLTVDADIMLSSKENAGLHLYTTNDKESKYNANLELFNISLKDITDILPYSPNITGLLNLDLYLKQNDKEMILSSDVRIDSITYENSYIGNETLEVVYFPKSDNRHYLDVRLNHDDEEVLLLCGDYINDKETPGLEGEISLNRLPLELTKVFMKDTGMKLSGYINSKLTAQGPLSELSTNGHVQFEKAFFDAPLLGTELHFSEKPVNIKENKILFDDFNILAKGDNPFKINGFVDMSKLSNPEFKLNMSANDYEIVNAPRQKDAMLYGKMFIDFNAFIGGRLNNLNLTGNATLLEKSDITYVLQDAPISSDKELDGLVEFVNFQDTIKIKEDDENIEIGNIVINMGLKVEEGAKINADFDENRNSFLTLQGGGNLNMVYNNETGLNVTGNYTMNEGELKYALPIIPLKTFNIENGSKITWNGDILNPYLNIIALERITTSVTFDNNSIQPVVFDVGVKLSNTLNNIGLSFIISAPENAIIQDRLNRLDEETLNKYAITMLITGTYIGNSNNMTVSNALSSFLDAKINALAGNVMKNFNVDFGINDTQNAETGDAYKNYLFSFRQRFFNDRITFVVGGEVNSGNPPDENKIFINNLSLECKIDKNGNRYLRVFYDKNFESLFEGKITETGIGYVYKRKLNNLKELFIFKNKKKDKKIPRKENEKKEL